jgi:DNA polymerase
MATRLGEQQTAAPLVPARATIDRLQDAAAACRACDLWRSGTQTVFGDGSRQARIIFVGEQPGDEEHVQGKPFVGPAGRLLDRALVDAGIDRRDVYVTNVVKHFKWEPATPGRGKKRIHKKPNGREIRACRPWLDAEVRTLDPDLIVCLGATAAQALLGSKFLVSRRRGEFIESPGGATLFATVHPSSILRAPDSETRRLEYARFVEDLRLLEEWLKQHHG